MADYKIPNLCGASAPFNAMQSKFDDMINTAASPAGLIADAKALAASLEPDVTSLLDEVKNILPELPALPEVNLQAELTSLSGLSAGSFEHGTLLAEITTKFGSGLTAGGFSLDTLVSDAASAITGGTDLCGAVPNFTAPSAAGAAAVQIANAVLQPEGGSVTEKPSIQLANPNVTEATTKASTAFNKFWRNPDETKTIPTEDTGSYTPTTTSTSIAVTSQGKGSTIEATTPANQSYKDGTKTKKKNVSDKGITTQTYVKTMDFIDLKEESVWNRGKVGFLQDGTVDLQLEHIPIKIISVGAGITKISIKDEPFTDANFAKWEFANNSNVQASYDTGELAPDWIHLFPPNYKLSAAETRRVRRGAGVAKDTWTMEEPGTVNITRGGDIINGHIVAKGGKVLDQKQWVYYRIVYSYLSKYDPN